MISHELIGDENRRLGAVVVTELAERVELPKSTVARLLAALEAESAVEQIETGAFAGSTGPDQRH